MIGVPPTTLATPQFQATPTLFYASPGSCEEKKRKRHRGSDLSYQALEPWPVPSSEVLLDPPLFLGLPASAENLAGSWRVSVVRVPGLEPSKATVVPRSRTSALFLTFGFEIVVLLVLPPPLVPVVPLSLVGSANNPSRREDSLRLQGPPASPMPAGNPAAPTKPAGPWRDCAEAHEAGHRQSRVYELRPGRQGFAAWCEQQLEGGGWTVIQRRQDGSVNFFTTWQQYKVGFGRPDGEYWLGLEPIYQLTSRGDHELLVLLEDWGGRGARAHYDSFSLEPESDHYRLRLGQYRGDAGDSLSWHNDKPFSTVDRDRDSYSGNCALYQRGGWWYHACAHSNLNGVWHRGGHYRSRYQDGVYWAEFRGGAYSLRKAAMLIRPVGP
ncbi:PREDICTED: angiopoietin-related protein 6 [Dipodomys ordii]|uniref:Angiopoietin-related protein 6 n=1 Tax=Dipodomys ordii TaxID=10020 RepID=A0A1S3GMA9_DIPOR|nr:PREDICTED: angiopoietin-related protein 6 [Dipodomys ordii]